jgi:hypothetical protein
MVLAGDCFELTMSLTPGTYRYKYIVDNQWIAAPSARQVFDTQGSQMGGGVSNEVEVVGAVDASNMSAAMTALNSSLVSVNATNGHVSSALVYHPPGGDLPVVASIGTGSAPKPTVSFDGLTLPADSVVAATLSALFTELANKKSSISSSQTTAAAQYATILADTERLQSIVDGLRADLESLRTQLNAPHKQNITALDQMVKDLGTIRAAAHSSGMETTVAAEILLQTISRLGNQLADVARDMQQSREKAKEDDLLQSESLQRIASVLRDLKEGLQASKATMQQADGKISFAADSLRIILRKIAEEAVGVPFFGSSAFKESVSADNDRVIQVLHETFRTQIMEMRLASETFLRQAADRHTALATKAVALNADLSTLRRAVTVSRETFAVNSARQMTTISELSSKVDAARREVAAAVSAAVSAARATAASPAKFPTVVLVPTSPADASAGAIAAAAAVAPFTSSLSSIPAFSAPEFRPMRPESAATPATPTKPVTAPAAGLGTPPPPPPPPARSSASESAVGSPSERTASPPPPPPPRAMSASVPPKAPSVPSGGVAASTASMPPPPPSAPSSEVALLDGVTADQVEEVGKLAALLGEVRQTVMTAKDAHVVEAAIENLALRLHKLRVAVALNSSSNGEFLSRMTAMAGELASLKSSLHFQRNQVANFNDLQASTVDRISVSLASLASTMDQLQGTGNITMHTTILSNLFKGFDKIKKALSTTDAMSRAAVSELSDQLVEELESLIKAASAASVNGNLARQKAAVVRSAAIALQAEIAELGRMCRMLVTDEDRKFDEQCVRLDRLQNSILGVADAMTRSSSVQHETGGKTASSLASMIQELTGLRAAILEKKSITRAEEALVHMSSHLQNLRMAVAMTSGGNAEQITLVQAMNSELTSLFDAVSASKRADQEGRNFQHEMLARIEGQLRGLKVSVDETVGEANAGAMLQKLSGQISVLGETLNSGEISTSAHVLEGLERGIDEFAADIALVSGGGSTGSSAVAMQQIGRIHRDIKELQDGVQKAKLEASSASHTTRKAFDNMQKDVEVLAEKVSATPEVVSALTKQVTELRDALVTREAVQVRTEAIVRLNEHLNAMRTFAATCGLFKGPEQAGQYVAVLAGRLAELNDAMGTLVHSGTGETLSEPVAAQHRLAAISALQNEIAAYRSRLNPNAPPETTLVAICDAMQDEVAGLKAITAQQLSTDAALRTRANLLALELGAVKDSSLALVRRDEEASTRLREAEVAKDLILRQSQQAQDRLMDEASAERRVMETRANVIREQMIDAVSQARAQRDAAQAQVELVRLQMQQVAMSENERLRTESDLTKLRLESSLEDAIRNKEEAEQRLENQERILRAEAEKEAQKLLAIVEQKELEKREILELTRQQLQRLEEEAENTRRRAEAAVLEADQRRRQTEENAERHRQQTVLEAQEFRKEALEEADKRKREAFEEAERRRREADEVLAQTQAEKAAVQAEKAAAEEAARAATSLLEQKLTRANTLNEAAAVEIKEAADNYRLASDLRGRVGVLEHTLLAERRRMIQLEKALGLPQSSPVIEEIQLMTATVNAGALPIPPSPIARQLFTGVATAPLAAKASNGAKDAGSTDGALTSSLQYAADARAAVEEEAERVRAAARKAAEEQAAAVAQNANPFAHSPHQILEMARTSAVAASLAKDREIEEETLRSFIRPGARRAASPSPSAAGVAGFSTSRKLSELAAVRLKQASLMATGMSEEEAIATLRYREIMILAEAGDLAAKHVDLLRKLSSDVQREVRGQIAERGVLRQKEAQQKIDTEAKNRSLSPRMSPAWLAVLSPTVQEYQKHQQPRPSKAAARLAVAIGSPAGRSSSRFASPPRSGSTLRPRARADFSPNISSELESTLSTLRKELAQSVGRSQEEINAIRENIATVESVLGMNEEADDAEAAAAKKQATEAKARASTSVRKAVAPAPVSTAAPFSRAPATRTYAPDSIMTSPVASSASIRASAKKKVVKRPNTREELEAEILALERLAALGSSGRK